MSISGIGIANSYLYKSVNKSNNRENGTALFDWAGRPTASEPQKCQNNRFSVNDAYNSMRMNGKFRSEIGEHYLQGFNTNDRSVNLLVQSNGEVQKVENERYVIDVSDKIEGNWCIYDKKSNESFVFYPMSTRMKIQGKIISLPAIHGADCESAPRSPCSSKDWKAAPGW